MKPSPKVRWKKLHSWTRLMFRIHDGAGTGIPFEVDGRLQRLWHANDRMAGKSPGRYLLLMSRKRNTIARGLPWMGFRFREPIYNCRCVATPIVPK